MQFARLTSSQPIEGFGASVIDGAILAPHNQCVRVREPEVSRHRGQAMDTPCTDRDVLEIFVESADELLGSCFQAQAKTGGIPTSLSWSQVDGFVAQRAGPEREAVKALLLTLRLFCQNNEPTSLCNMEDRISASAIAANLREEFRKSRANFNIFLDGPPSVGFPAGSGADTRRDIFNTFVCGVFAHANPRCRRQVKDWESLPYYEDVQAQFDLILLNFLAALAPMANVCRQLLDAGRSTLAPEPVSRGRR